MLRRSLDIAAALSLALAAAPSLAQTPPAQTPSPQTPPAQAAPAPPRPFPEGAKIAYVNIQRIASDSAEGKISAARVQALIQKKQNEGADKNKQLAASQQKLQQSGGLMNDAARAQLEKEVERLQVEAQRFQQDAQAEINELQQELQADFQKKLMPVIQQLAAEKGLQLLFSMADAGIIWGDPGLDLTGDVIRKFDGASAAKPSSPPKTPNKP